MDRGVCISMALLQISKLSPYMIRPYHLYSKIATFLKKHADPGLAVTKSHKESGN